MGEEHTSDRGVSPVIGVILMVAITVILAAVTAAFVLGINEGNDPTPTASFDFDYDEDDGEVEITMQSGDPIDVENLYVRGDVPGGEVEWDAANTNSASQVVAGKTQTVSVTGNDYEIRVVWESDAKSSTMQEDSGPAA